MRLRYNKKGLVYFMAAVEFPDGSLRICETIEFTDKSRTRHEVLPHQVELLVQPIACAMLLHKWEKVTDRDFLEKMTEYISSPPFKKMVEEQGWSEINLGPWVKKGFWKPSIN